MDQASTPPPLDDASTQDSAATLRRLLYRWFVQYNPTYLLSAALVFAGCFLWSRGAVEHASLTGTLGIPLIAETYAFALIGGAAMLTRIGQRRPATLLVLILIVYQWDTTLHTEACAYLGSVGTWATLAWLALFVGKLFAIGWALRVRLTRPAWVVLIVAGVGLALMPYLLLVLDRYALGALLAMWLFALCSLYRGDVITSLVPLDAWGQTVLRRVTLAAWSMSGLLIALHVVMWCSTAEVSLAPIALAAPLLALTRVRDEKRVWAIVTGTLVIAAIAQPSAFFATSWIAAAGLFLRVFVARFETLTTQPSSRTEAPYRASETQRPSACGPESAPVTISERHRALAGALFTIYLGAWTIHWSHGVWPTHVLALDFTMTFVTMLALWRTRATFTFLTPLALIFGHFVVQARLLPVPHSSMAIGETIIGLGFALLAGSLALSFRLRARRLA